APTAGAAYRDPAAFPVGYSQRMSPVACMSHTTAHAIPQDHGQHTICPQCDWVMHVDTPAARELACCPRCGEPVVTGPVHALSHTMAWALAALTMLALAFGFDFLSFEFRGIAHTMTLLDAMLDLYANGYPGLALLFILTTTILPALFL